MALFPFDQQPGEVSFQQLAAVASLPPWLLTDLEPQPFAYFHVAIADEEEKLSRLSFLTKVPSGSTYREATAECTLNMSMHESIFRVPMRYFLNGFGGSKNQSDQLSVHPPLL